MTSDRLSQLTTGGIVILIGILLLLSTTGVIAFESVWEWVPLIFVVLGVWALVSSGFRNLVGPVMIVAIAGAFLARNVGLLADDVIGTWWPLFVILFGVLLLVSRSRRQRRAHLATAQEVSVTGVFGTDERRLTGEAFAEASVVAVFGDAILDLRATEVADPPAVVDVTAVFADAEVRVPPEWTVRVEVLNLLGDTTDRRPPSAERDDGDTPELVVTGVSMFADIEITD